ncbi:phosphatase PAP2 family protein [Cellulomonas massiliensis]|uniref:phosphatase PAP2 family protein n=1 Tax=Cellulomonas massiliensis TaxID=1465811 RepID=UPI0003756478|nr:phosphatase PAP2 family protein [Cellulomonas massiliensis]
MTGRTAGRARAGDEGPAPATPRRRAADLVVLIAGAAAFLWLARRMGTDVAQATANAEAFQSLERAVGIDVEPAANRWLAQRPPLAVAAVAYYRLYYLPLAAVLLGVVLARNDAYRRLRVTVLAVAVIALLAYWAVPLSPPRFAMPGIVDVVAEHDPIAGEASRDLESRTHLTAFPSMHTGWSALAAYLAWSALRTSRPRLALLVWLFPVGMVLVVVTTGNHDVLDVIGSAALLAAAIGVTRLWERRRRAGQRRPSRLPPPGQDGRDATA